MSSSLREPTSDFATTHWSIVLRGGARGTQGADEALAALCQTYWLPLYSFARRKTSDVHEAQDLTQAFFAKILEKNAFASASPERGRFRSFLLASFQNFLTNEWHKGQAHKRGGGATPLSLDWAAGESRLHLEPAHELTPERLFERQWALTLLEQVVQRLAGEFAAAGKERQFEVLKDSLTGDRLDYSATAAELEMTADATRQAVHRLRKRYRELLRDEVAQTIDDPREIDQEIQSLIDVLGS
jgi:RNA polymerase sigma-70 factor (ECF subfamily)